MKIFKGIVRLIFCVALLPFLLLGLIGGLSCAFIAVGVDAGILFVRFLCKKDSNNDI